MVDVKALDLVNKKYEIAVKKREQWEKGFAKLHQKMAKAKDDAARKKVMDEIEKYDKTRRKADDELRKASDEVSKRIRELSKGS